MIEWGLKIRMSRTALRMGGGVFFKEVWMEGGKGSAGPASHTRIFKDLVMAITFELFNRFWCFNFWLEAIEELHKSIKVKFFSFFFLEGEGVQPNHSNHPFCRACDNRSDFTFTSLPFIHKPAK